MAKQSAPRLSRVGPLLLLAMISLSRHLYWDVDREQIDPEIHAAWLVRRVLEYGRWSDFREICSYYGKSRLSEIVVELRSLEPRAHHFCAAYFGIPPAAFRCSTPIASPHRS